MMSDIITGRDMAEAPSGESYSETTVCVAGIIAPVFLRVVRWF